MCTEFLLAIIYFFILGVVNYFFFQFIKNCFQNILYLFKIQKILSLFPEKGNQNLWRLFYFISLENSALRFLPLFKRKDFRKTKDILLIGKSYNYIKNIVKKNSISLDRDFYYFSLLETHYLQQD